MPRARWSGSFRLKYPRNSALRDAAREVVRQLRLRHPRNSGLRDAAREVVQPVRLMRHPLNSGLREALTRGGPAPFAWASSQLWAQRWCTPGGPAFSPDTSSQLWEPLWAMGFTNLFLGHSTPGTSPAPPLGLPAMQICRLAPPWAPQHLGCPPTTQQPQELRTSSPGN